MGGDESVEEAHCAAKGSTFREGFHNLWDFKVIFINWRATNAVSLRGCPVQVKTYPTFEQQI